ncbi:hypothetical protein N7471_006610 [Penicillium samsonianum]|uniref:uncharacterized protein n=1 Tax=Penicillium samsonianum TaxID=1882272 RepID=UPI0025467F0D|nr:uncharacterized protein N7471_006610 [Penicillium samsonianum]KAJ6140124.1 hypothetical protein N7471_006610 [Penicillium samsonianum]
MADEKIWFPGPAQKHKVSTLSETTPSNWKVLQKINEDVQQWSSVVMPANLPMGPQPSSVSRSRFPPSRAM